MKKTKLYLALVQLDKIAKCEVSLLSPSKVYEHYFYELLLHYVDRKSVV